MEGIVLAGGFSSRAKLNKMVLKLGGKEIILRTIEGMHGVCERIILVTGHYHLELFKLFENYEYVEVVYNENYESGMFSSIKKGVELINSDFMIIPGDCPLVKHETYEEIIKANKQIVVPSYNMKLGHPIFFRKTFKDKILNTLETNLKAFRNQYDFYILETQDSGVLIDIDDLETYNKIKERID